MNSVDPTNLASASKDPLTYSYLTYGWVILLSVWGGAVNFHSKVQKGLARPYNLTEIFGEIATSAFAGIITFYGAEYAQLDRLLEAIMVAISGHMGTRIIFWAERLLEARAAAALGISPEEMEK